VAKEHDMSRTRFERYDGNGYVMTRERFEKAVRDGNFTDYDGYGELAKIDPGTKRTLVSNRGVKPSSLVEFRWPQWATHVVWYNK
jgi:hypothetical protein